MSIRTLLGEYGELTNLQPDYQREIRWKKETMDGLIETVMSGGFMPALLVYRLQEDQRTDSRRFEMVDGQHRFTAIQKYIKSEMVSAGGKPFLITWDYEELDKTYTYVFFQRTAETEKWIEDHRGQKFAYMTEEEREAFKSFTVDVKEIKDRLTLDQRRGMFYRLQCGVQVRNSDKLKNVVEVPLIRFFSDDLKLEKPMKEALEFCWKDPKQYWLHWAVRLFLLLNPDSKGEEAAFATTDADIGKMIRNKSDSLDFKEGAAGEEQKKVFKETIDRFFSFLQTLPFTADKKVRQVALSPCQFYALFLHLSAAEEGRESVLVGHSAEWALSKKAPRGEKVHWDKELGVEEKKLRFTSALTELESISAPARAPESRKSIPKKLREMLWASYFSESETGSCFCCGSSIHKSENYHACHLIAHKRGGSDCLPNLRPGCRDCNLSMGTQDMREYKKQFYPEVKTPLSDAV
jgi:hypothetical protein